MALESSAQDPEALAIEALGFLAEEPERLMRFLDMTGLAPQNLRAAAKAPGFLGSVLDHLLADEGLLLAFSANRQIAPEAIGRARMRLPGGEPPAM